MCQLKSLVLYCLSFTGGLITCMSTADSEAPASNKTFVTSVIPLSDDRCRGVLP